jgi:hypothetical protein
MRIVVNNCGYEISQTDSLYIIEPKAYTQHTSNHHDTSISGKNPQSEDTHPSKNLVSKRDTSLPRLSVVPQSLGPCRIPTIKHRTLRTLMSAPTKRKSWCAAFNQLARENREGVLHSRKLIRKLRHTRICAIQRWILVKMIWPALVRNKFRTK